MGVWVRAHLVSAVLVALALPAALVGVDGAYRQLPWRGAAGCLVALVLLAGVARRLLVHAGLVLLAGAVVLNARGWAASQEWMVEAKNRLASDQPLAELDALLADSAGHADGLRRAVISAACQIAACVCFAVCFARVRRRAAVLASAGVLVSVLAALSATATAWDARATPDAVALPPELANCCDYGGAVPHPIVTTAFMAGTSSRDAWTMALLLLGAAVIALASTRPAPDAEQSEGSTA